MKKDNYLYILLHHSRTGGETFTSFVQANMPKEEILRVDDFDMPKELSERNKIRYLGGHTTYFGMHKLFPGKVPRYIITIRDPAKVKASMYNSRMMDFPEGKKQSFEKWLSLRKKNEMTSFFDEIYRSTNPNVVRSHRIRKWLRENILDKIDKTKTLHTFLKKLMRKQDTPNAEKQKFENAKKLLEECWLVCPSKSMKDVLELLFKSMGIKPNLRKYKVKSRIQGELSILNKEVKERIYRENPLDFKLYKYALKMYKDKKKKIEAQLK